MQSPYNQACFLPGTAVGTESGTCSIEQVVPGMQVWAYDAASQTWKLRPVERTFVHEYNGDLVSVVVDGDTIQVTGNHPFWVTDGDDLESRPCVEGLVTNDRPVPEQGRWIEARHLRIGDGLLSRANGRVTVLATSSRDESTKVFNFEVADLHTYVVGKSQILVHNKPLEYINRPEAPIGKLSKPNDAWFKQRGLDPHEIKGDIVGGGAQVSRYDVFKDQNNNLWVLPKNGKGEAQWYGRWIDE